MTRLAAGIEYVGTRYCGWQIQKHSDSVQAELEAALSRVADHPVRVTAAGRTDTGVHALGQVVHFDSPARRDPQGWALGTNTHLPPDISVRWVQPVSDQFHARFSARARRYRYLIHNARTRSGLWSDRAAWVKRPLDETLMQQAAQGLVGEHDFSAFRGSGCQSKSPVRTVHEIRFSRREELVVMEIRANAFLLHMVRNIVGSLMQVGVGDRDPAWIAQLLVQGQRTLAGMNAPPGGLYFTAAEYAPEFAIPPVPSFWAF